MTQTWTTSDRDLLIKHLDLTRREYGLIESTLTSYESSYGASAIIEVRSKLTSCETLQTSIDTKKQSSDYGITSQSVSGFYSWSKKEGTEIEGITQAYNAARHWLVKNLGLQSYCRIGQGKLSRA